MRLARAVAAIASGFLLPACGYWKVTPLTPAELVAQRKPEQIQVVYRAAQAQPRSIVLYYAAVVTDTLVGDTVWRSNDWLPPATRVTIPIADVVSVSTRAVEPKRSILLGVAIAAAVACWAFIELSQSIW